MIKRAANPRPKIAAAQQCNKECEPTNSIEHNTLHEMMAVLAAFSDGEKIEHRCIVEDRPAGHFLDDRWCALRNDMAAYELFDFQYYAYRIARDIDEHKHCKH